MSERPPRIFSREMKLAILRRRMAGENVSALARELKLRRKLLYAWRVQFRSGDPEALRTRGRPRKSAPAAPAEAPVAPVGSKAAAGKAEEAGAGKALAAAQRRVAELERKIGQQALELDFFRHALRQFEGKRRANDGLGAWPSMPGSRRSTGQPQAQSRAGQTCP
jgi:transposase